MRKIRYVNYIIINLIRLPLLKCLNIKCLNANLIQLISPSTSIELEKKGHIRINGRLHTEPGVFISSCNGAHLNFNGRIFVNRNTIIVCRDSITIDNGVTIGPNVVIYDHDHDLSSKGNLKTAPVSISDGAWIGAGSIILKGVTIGKNSVIAAGSVVTKSVPDNTVYYNEIKSRTREITE